MRACSKIWDQNAVQYLLTKGTIDYPNAWVLNKKGNWMIGTHHSLPIRDIVDKKNNHIGWMIGFFVSPNGSYIPDKIVFSCDEEQITEDAIEANLYVYGGRFVCILLTEALQRIYVDPSGSLSTVFSAERQVVASTSGLLSNELDDDLIHALGMPKSGLYFPFGFTAHRNIKRLLPNYYLDLKDFKTIRHWPQIGQLKTVEPADAAFLIAEIITRNIKAVARDNKICIPLTGGRDSRMLLACTKEIHSDIDFITIRSSKENSDTHIVDILKRKFNLNHRYLYRKQATELQLDEWLTIVGYAASGFAWKDHQTYSDFNYNRVLMPAICGEVGRGFFYGKLDSENYQISAKDLLKRMKIPAYKSFLPEVEEYLVELRALELNFFQILDFTYNEQRLGSWAGPSETGGDMFSIGKLWPMCHRKIINQFLNLPISAKLNNYIPERVIELTWPELLEVPFNTFTGPTKIVKNLLSLVKRGPTWLIERFRARKYF